MDRVRVDARTVYLSPQKITPPFQMRGLRKHKEEWITCFHLPKRSLPQFQGIVVPVISDENVRVIVCNAGTTAEDDGNDTMFDLILIGTQDSISRASKLMNSQMELLSQWWS